MRKRWICLLAALWVCVFPFAAPAEEDAALPEIPDRAGPPAEYAYSGKTVREYDSDSLRYTVEKVKIDRVVCYLSKIWVQDPAKQIVKQTAEWRKNIQLPIHMAKKVPEAALVINGSGYVSPTYPWIPEDYPGSGKDYFYTPLGSLTVTGGEVFRNLEGIPYYGLTLEQDGLQMYVGEDNEAVLARGPLETWSFYVNCPMLRDNEDLLPEDWSFADRYARRTVIARVNRNNYLVLTVTREGGRGLTLRRVSTFFRENFVTEWVYNLDGGPSSALICRAKGKKSLKTVTGGSAKDADIMAFRELPEEP